MTSVVYSALFGRYEELIEQPIALDSDVPFICFTDDPELTSSTWQIVLVEPQFPWDSVRNARMAKIRAMDVWAPYERSLWIDNRVLLKQDPAAILDCWLEDAPFAIPTHSYRESVDAEFDEVIASAYDQLDRVREQRHVYRHWCPDVLRERPYWTGMMARSHTAEVRGVMSTWSDVLLRHSRRDQLSLNYAAHRAGLQPRRIEIDNHSSEWHEWVSVRKKESVLFNAAWNYTLPTHGIDAVRKRVSVLKHKVWAARNKL